MTGNFFFFFLEEELKMQCILLKKNFFKLIIKVFEHNERKSKRYNNQSLKQSGETAVALKTSE